MRDQYDVIRIVWREIREAGARHGLRTHQAEDIAASVDEALRRELGPSSTYIPCPDKGERNAALLGDYRSGIGFAELSRRYRLSEKWTRELIAILLAE